MKTKPLVTVRAYAEGQTGPWEAVHSALTTWLTLALTSVIEDTAQQELKIAQCELRLRLIGAEAARGTSKPCKYFEHAAAGREVEVHHKQF